MCASELLENLKICFLVIYISKCVKNNWLCIIYHYILQPVSKGLTHCIISIYENTTTFELTLATGNISSRFKRNSEAFASEFLEYVEEMFPQYYVQRGNFCKLNYEIT